jgi:hypothetical protein
MRIGAWLIAMLGFAGSAAADAPRYAPAVGTTVTFRIMFTTNFSDRQLTFGHIYKVTTTASDGVTAENSMTPLALIRHCPDSDTSTNCRQARNFPNITREGDLITIPIPPEIATGLTKIGKLTARDFVRYAQVFPFPGAQDPEETAKPQIGATPLWVQGNAVACDDAVLDTFFPLGKKATLTVSCTNTTERSQSRLSTAKDTKATEDVTMDLAFVGHDHIAVPAGDFEVASGTVKTTPKSGNGPTVEGDWAFVETLGFSARSTLLTRFPNSPNTVHVMRELIKVGP